MNDMFDISFLGNSLPGVLGDAQKTQERRLQALEFQCCSQTAEAGIRFIYSRYNFRCAPSPCFKNIQPLSCDVHRIYAFVHTNLKFHAVCTVLFHVHDM